MENEVIVGEYSGKTTQEAIDEGLKELGITAEEAEIEVLEEPKKGFLGIGSSKARVKITKIVASLPDKSDSERTTEFLNGLFEILGLEVTIGEVTEGEKIVIDLETEKTGDLIGRRGEILDSIQTLAGAVANIGREEYKRVVVDCQNYREGREDKLRNLANKLAAKAIAAGRKMKMEAMNPYERRIVHAALSENTEVKTQSEGKEPNRYVVIIPNNLKPYEGKKNYGKKPYDKNRKPYNGKRSDGKYSDRKEGERRNNYERAKKNYTESNGTSTGTGTGTGSYVKRESYKKSSSSFFGTYLGNSKSNTENKDE